MSARLLLLAKFLQLLACSDFRSSSLTVSFSSENNVSRMVNWETLVKLARALNISGKMLPRFVDVYWK